MPDWILLVPILFPLVGALALALAQPRVSARARPWLPLVFLAMEILAILVNIAPGNHSFTISTWSQASFSIALQLDGVSLLLLLTLFVPFLALWLIAPPAQTPRGARRSPFGLFPVLVLTAAVLLTASANLITAYLTWVVLDLTVFAWRLAYDIERETALRTLALSQVAAFMLLAGALAHSANAQPTAASASLIALAFWARLALFPFQWTLPTRGTDLSDLWLSRGVPLLAAANLWLRWATLNIDAPATLIGALTAAAIIAAAIWIWREEQPTRAIVVSVAQSMTFVPLAIAFGGNAAVAFALWLTLGTVIAIALFETAQRWRAENRNRYPRLIWFAGILALAGLPLTPAFLGRVGVYVSLWETGQWLLLLVASATTMLTLAPLWNLGFELSSAENREPTRVEYAGLGVLVATFAALALAPMLIAHALAPGVGDAAERAIDRVIRTSDAPGVAIGFALLILPVVGSYWMRGAARDFRPRANSPILRAARLLDLDWLARGLTAIGYRLGALARGASTIAEENPTIWILLAGLWIAIFISIAR